MNISYADDTARSYCTNPSWVTFRGGFMDLSLIGEPASKDYSKEAAAFLERHFRRKPTVGAASEVINRSDGHCEEEELQREVVVVWHTWLLEEVKPPPSQYAVITEWIAPETQALSISSCSWHFKNCMAGRLIVSHKDDLAKCYCHRIKKYMDNVNNLVDLELQSDKSSADFSTVVPVLTEKVLNATEVLKKLNELLDLQDKRNRRYKRQLK